MSFSFVRLLQRILRKCWDKASQWLWLGELIHLRKANWWQWKIVWIPVLRYWSQTGWIWLYWLPSNRWYWVYQQSREIWKIMSSGHQWQRMIWFQCLSKQLKGLLPESTTGVSYKIYMIKDVIAGNNFLRVESKSGCIP